MDQVALGMSLLRPPSLSPEAFKTLLRRRGWRMADAAVRWNIRAETLSRVAGDPARETRWDDMVRALPLLTRRERAAATAARLALHPSRPRPKKETADPIQGQLSDARPVEPFAWEAHDEDDDEPFAGTVDGLRYQGYVGLGSELVTITEIGSFAREGAYLMVIDTRLNAGPEGDAREDYLCESPAGETLWLDPDEMDEWVVSTGKTRQGF